jgi:DNA end-binding protein Ku
MATSVWKGHITFGLVSIPVKLSAAARSETISFNQLHKTDHSRVKQVLFCQAEDKPVDRSELTKGFEYEKGKYVEIDDEDLKSIQPKTAKVMEISEFVRMQEVDGVYLESSYYVEPDEAGEKPYTLLFAALKETGRAAIAQITMHSREHTVCLRPGKKGMILHTLYYQEEIREMSEFRTDTSRISQQELALAQNLIEAMSGEYNPLEFKDTYRERVQAMIDAKVKGNKVVQMPQPQELAPVIDIMDALKRSLSTFKKPAASETLIAEANSAPVPVDKPRSRKRKTG